MCIYTHIYIYIYIYIFNPRSELYLYYARTGIRPAIEAHRCVTLALVVLLDRSCPVWHADTTRVAPVHG